MKQVREIQYYEAGSVKDLIELLQKLPIYPNENPESKVSEDPQGTDTSSHDLKVLEFKVHIILNETQELLITGQQPNNTYGGEANG
jgi:hypothetical protein